MVWSLAAVVTQAGHGGLFQGPLRTMVAVRMSPRAHSGEPEFISSLRALSNAETETRRRSERYSRSLTRFPRHFSMAEPIDVQRHEWRIMQSSLNLRDLLP